MDRRDLITAAIALLAVLGLACGGGSAAAKQEAARQEIQVVLEAYLPLLAEAYASGDLAPLEPWVAIKEIARIHKRIEDYGLQGRSVVPTFHQVTVEEVKVWNYSNALATTHEVWDVEVRAIGTDRVLAAEYDQPNRIKYQLKREKGTWRILFRTVQE